MVNVATSNLHVDLQAAAQDHWLKSRRPFGTVLYSIIHQINPVNSCNNVLIIFITTTLVIIPVSTGGDFCPKTSYRNRGPVVTRNQLNKTTNSRMFSAPHQLRPQQHGSMYNYLTSITLNEIITNHSYLFLQNNNFVQLLLMSKSS